MKEFSKNVKFTTQVIEEKTAKRGWWIDLFPDKHSAAKAKERALAGTLKYDTIEKMMRHFKMKCVREPQQALWDEMEMIKFHVYYAKKSFGFIEAYTPEEAKEIAAKQEWSNEETFIDGDGDEILKWKNLMCKLIAEEVK